MPQSTERFGVDINAVLEELSEHGEQGMVLLAIEVALVFFCFAAYLLI